MLEAEPEAVFDGEPEVPETLDFFAVGTTGFTLEELTDADELERVDLAAGAILHARSGKTRAQIMRVCCEADALAKKNREGRAADTCEAGRAVVSLLRVEVAKNVV